MNIKWKVVYSKSVIKQVKKLNKVVLLELRFLVKDLLDYGPAVYCWPNYGKLQSTAGQIKYHCHLKKGRPTYVCCWQVMNKAHQIIEVYYVGTHEKAPY